MRPIRLTIAVVAVTIVMIVLLINLDGIIGSNL
jgi:preprotein translocase subunit SecE